MKELVSIQSDLKCKKSQFNKFGKYYYRNCEDILEAVKPLLKKEECFLVISDEVIQIGERYYIQATATITNKEDKCVTVSALAREAENQPGMQDSQLTGATSSYARKYCLNGLFCIDDTKDADAGTPQANTDVKPQGIGVDNIKWLTDFCKRINVTTSKQKQDLLAHYKFSVEGTTPGQFVAVKARMMEDHPPEPTNQGRPE